jgi:pyruvate/2-oxoglutarate dehydrogenase complex dihydrolipoamide acyltransferase (E2) component
MPQPVRVDENLWASAVAPEGVLEWWFVPDGAQVAAGQRVAEVQIEGVRHEVVAPAAGELSVVVLAGAVLDPGSVIGQVMAS